MRTCKLNPEVTENGVLIFKIENPVQEITFDQIPNIESDLLELSIQRFIIRKKTKNEKQKRNITFKNNQSC